MTDSERKYLMIFKDKKNCLRFVSNLVSLAKRTCDGMLVSMFSDVIMSLTASDKPLSLKFNRCYKQFENALIAHVSLVSTHAVCERLSAMQGLPDCGKAKCLLILPRIPIHNLTTQEYPSPPEMKSWPDLDTLIPPRPLRVCGD